MPNSPPKHQQGRPKPKKHFSKHATPRQQTHARRFRSSQAWQKLRELKLARTPLCQGVKCNGRITPATQVHHLYPIATHYSKRNEIDNLVSTCVSCHEEAGKLENQGKLTHHLYILENV